LNQPTDDRASKLIGPEPKIRCPTKGISSGIDYQLIGIAIKMQSKPGWPTLKREKFPAESLLPPNFVIAETGKNETAPSGIALEKIRANGAFASRKRTGNWLQIFAEIGKNPALMQG
jgi:hypothetical protein